MSNINEILGDNFDEYCKTHFVSSHQIKIVKNIINCRTEKMGRRILICDDCRHEEILYCSCRNRHCPLCLTFEKEKWINKRKQDMINTQYFHVVFTLPEELKMIVKANEIELYDILFKSVSETIMELSRDPKHIGVETGAMLILHTWDQQLKYHPHCHGLIPGGGIGPDGHWKYSKKDFFIHVKVMSKLFKGKFLYYLEELHKKKSLVFPINCRSLKSYSKFYDFKINLMNKNWYVYSKETFTSPKAVIEYLGRYTHKIGMTNNRIKEYSKGKVTFEYTDNKDNGNKKLLTLETNEFIRRFLLHILPYGYMKIRYYGLLSNRNKKTKLKLCQIETDFKANPEETKEAILKRITKGNIFKCPKCGGNNFHLAKIVLDNAFWRTG